MLRASLRKLSRASSTVPVDFRLRRSPSLLRPQALVSPARYLCARNITNVNPVALQMIDYALGLARSHKTDESYAQALLVLEQGVTSQSQGREDATIENSIGLILLATSTLLSEWGHTDEAIQALMRIQDLTSASLGIQVAAIEALVGLNLELGLDDTSSVLADKCLKLLDKGQQVGDEYGYNVFEARAKAIKGLVGLVQGDMGSGKEFFDGSQGDGCIGNAALSYGEFSHIKKDFTLAKELYQKVISELYEKKNFSDRYALGASNMASEEVLLAATCSLGQLESHSGNFGDAEEILTKALKIAEGHFGTQHPKVGTVLTCIALMFRQKAIAERSSSLLIQEGLYRKAMDLLKAPSLDLEDAKDNVDKAKENVERRDIIALARGGYAEALCVQQNRKGEGERMKTWAESAWTNRRLSLANALDISESSCKVPVIDTRISRVL